MADDPHAQLRRHGLRHLPAIVLVVLAGLLAGCTSTPTATASSAASQVPTQPASQASTPGPTTTVGPAPTPTPGVLDLARLQVSLERFASIDGAAIALAADAADGRLLVADQGGRVWSVGLDGTVDHSPVIDLRKGLTSGGERGLLGLALHPSFPADRRAFVDFTDTNGDTVVGSLVLDPGSPGALGVADLRQVLHVDQPFSNHNGGALQFGPDGRLHVALGDGGSGGDPQGNGQNPNVLLGKILRLDVDASSSTPYASPPDNPFAAGGGRPEIWLLGLRNPWRFSFDRLTGDLWIGDVGQNAWEEVDVVRTGSRGGWNLGWNVMEGAHCYAAASCDTAGLVPPVAEYGHDLGCAIVGGYVYRGPSYPFLVGAYLFSDTCSGRIFAIDSGTDGPATPVEVGNAGGGVSSFGEGPDGELYLLTLDGRIRRVVATQG